MDYDYVFTGGGLSATLLAAEIIANPKFAGQKILILDREPEAAQDRTWCFWEEGDGHFDAMLAKSWSDALFRSKDFSRTLDLLPFRYKCLRGDAFYGHFRPMLQNSGVETRCEKALSISDSGTHGEVQTETAT